MPARIPGFPWGPQSRPQLPDGCSQSQKRPNGRLWNGPETDATLAVGPGVFHDDRHITRANLTHQYLDHAGRAEQLTGGQLSRACPCCSDHDQHRTDDGGVSTTCAAPQTCGGAGIPNQCRKWRWHRDRLRHGPSVGTEDGRRQHTRRQQRVCMGRQRPHRLPARLVLPNGPAFTDFLGLEGSYLLSCLIPVGCVRR
jgi:hypothetical protein